MSATCWRRVRRRLAAVLDAEPLRPAGWLLMLAGAVVALIAAWCALVALLALLAGR